MTIENVKIGDKEVKVNTGYYYQDNDFDMYFNNRPEIKGYIGAYGKGDIGNFDLKDSISEKLSHGPVCLAYNLNSAMDGGSKHWVAVKITRNENGKCDLTFADSMDKTFNGAKQDELFQALSNAEIIINSFDAYKYTWHQGASVACGPASIDSIEAMLDGRRTEVPKLKDEELRARQLLTIGSDAFKNKQFKNDIHHNWVSDEAYRATRGRLNYEMSEVTNSGKKVLEYLSEDDTEIFATTIKYSPPKEEAELSDYNTRYINRVRQAIEVIIDKGKQFSDVDVVSAGYALLDDIVPDSGLIMDKVIAFSRYLNSDEKTRTELDEIGIEQAGKKHGATLDDKEKETKSEEALDVLKEQYKQLLDSTDYRNDLRTGLDGFTRAEYQRLGKKILGDDLYRAMEKAGDIDDKGDFNTKNRKFIEEKIPAGETIEKLTKKLIEDEYRLARKGKDYSDSDVLSGISDDTDREMIKDYLWKMADKDPQLSLLNDCTISTDEANDAKKDVAKALGGLDVVGDQEKINPKYKGTLETLEAQLNDSARWCSKGDKKKRDDFWNKIGATGLSGVLYELKEWHEKIFNKQQAEAAYNQTQEKPVTPYNGIGADADPLMDGATFKGFIITGNPKAGTVAAEKGLKEGDVILANPGQSKVELLKRIHTLKSGEEVKINVLRKETGTEEVMTLTTQLIHPKYMTAMDNDRPYEVAYETKQQAYGFIKEIDEKPTELPVGFLKKAGFKKEFDAIAEKLFDALQEKTAELLHPNKEGVTPKHVEARKEVKAAFFQNKVEQEKTAPRPPSKSGGQSFLG
jgi:hypothetical protein